MFIREGKTQQQLFEFLFMKVSPREATSVLGPTPDTPLPCQGLSPLSDSLKCCERAKQSRDLLRNHLFTSEDKQAALLNRLRLPGAPPALGGLVQWQRTTAEELFSARLPLSDTHCPPEGRISLAVYSNLNRTC